MAYSIDFRKCVLENLESGKTWDEVISIFSISRSTLSYWVNLSKTGSLKDSDRAPYKVRKIDSQVLKDVLERNPDATLKELAYEFNCRTSSIHKRLKKLDITRKKNNPIHRER